LAVFAGQQAWYREDLTQFGQCMTAVVEGGQLYRVATSEFTHGGVGHILFNASAMLVFGMTVEKHYGSFLFLFLNLWLGLLSSGLQLGFEYAMVYAVPSKFVDLHYLRTCSIGYSNILFGVLMVDACGLGDLYTTIYGFKVRKALYPLILLVFTAIAVPESSFSGHLCGIIAATLLMFCGLHVLLPRQNWIESWEEMFVI
jgi:rhomboid domain-containing protein 1